MKPAEPPLRDDDVVVEQDDSFTIACKHSLIGGCGGSDGPSPGGACTDLYAFGLSVSVSDGNTFQSICDATVTAVDGEYSETLQTGPSSGTSCLYLGAGERPGTYTITAVKSGYMNATQSNVKVVSDGCHVSGVAVKLTLVVNVS